MRYIISGVKVRRTALLVSVAVVASAFSYGCTESKTNETPKREFNARRALGFIEEQVAFGPRVPGSPAWANCKNYLIAYFDSLGYEVEQDDFVHVDYITGQAIPLTNMIITQKEGPGVEGRPVLFCAHWDSRPRSEQDPDPARRADSLPAANDGASGVAMLMELAALFKEAPPRAPVSFALFDGEDWGREGDINQYSLGAKEFARKLNPESYRYAILFDIIAHPDARFYRELYSDRFAGQITRKVWSAAKAMGVSRFVDTVGQGVVDDHLPLLNAGLPTTDIIDMSYKYWHTTADTPDKCDSAALYDVGSVVIRVMYQEK
jgi:Peptidase family M28